MATAQTIIDRGMRLIGALASGESPTSAETTDVLAALNGMLESWRNERLMAFAWQDESKVLTPSDGSYTIGATGDFTTWAAKIEHAYITNSGTDTFLDPLDALGYDGIPDKTTTGTPQYYYFEKSYPLGILKLWPVPDAADTLHIRTWVVLSGFATAATSVSLPPGYEDALAFNLAIRIAPEFEKKVSAEVAQIAIETKGSIKRLNNRPIMSATGLMFGGNHHNILTDSP